MAIVAGDQHHRHVAVDAAPAVFRKIVEAAANKPTLAPWAFMIPTAARPSEALNTKWEEIDLGKELWTCPGARMKTGKDHVVPPSGAALAVLRRQAEVRTGDYVFPGRSSGAMSYSNFADAATQAGFDAGAPHG